MKVVVVLTIIVLLSVFFTYPLIWMVGENKNSNLTGFIVKELLLAAGITLLLFAIKACYRSK